jgi:hypothetical protein
MQSGCNASAARKTVPPRRWTATPGRGGVNINPASSHPLRGCISPSYRQLLPIAVTARDPEPIADPGRPAAALRTPSRALICLGERSESTAPGTGPKYRKIGGRVVCPGRSEGRADLGANPRHRSWRRNCSAGEMPRGAAANDISTTLRGPCQSQIQDRRANQRSSVRLAEMSPTAHGRDLRSDRSFHSDKWAVFTSGATEVQVLHCWSTAWRR